MAERIELTIAEQRGDASAPLAHQHPPARSLYAHVPFCFHKCHYCDFYSFVDTRDRQGAFTEALGRELRALAPHAQGRSMRTIFFGGGTPSLLRADLWRGVLRVLREVFDCADTGLEFTVECNPETVTPELMGVLREGGVNRVSIGAQSFDKRYLKTLERWHDPDNVERALETAQRAGIGRRSIDLIFATPGQTLADWMSDIDSACALAARGLIEHVSCYALTYEPNTAMTARLRAGEFAAAEEDLEADMYEAAVERLGAIGLERYEVSNFARPGAECRHNLAYWRQEQWLAAGPSASAHIGGMRWKNVPRLTDWLDGVEASGGFSPIVDFEDADPLRALVERVMTGLRLREGLNARELFDSAGALGAGPALQAAIDRAEKQGLLRVDAERVRLTARAWLVADGVASDLMRAISARERKSENARG